MLRQNETSSLSMRQLSPPPPPPPTTVGATTPECLEECCGSATSRFALRQTSSCHCYTGAAAAIMATPRNSAGSPEAFILCPLVLSVRIVTREESCDASLWRFCAFAGALKGAVHQNTKAARMLLLLLCVWVCCRGQQHM